MTNCYLSGISRIFWKTFTHVCTNILQFHMNISIQTNEGAFFFSYMKVSTAEYKIRSTRNGLRQFFLHHHPHSFLHFLILYATAKVFIPNELFFMRASTFFSIHVQVRDKLRANLKCKIKLWRTPNWLYEYFILLDTTLLMLSNSQLNFSIKLFNGIFY